MQTIGTVDEFSDRRNGRSTAGQTRPVKRTAATPIVAVLLKNHKKFARGRTRRISPSCHAKNNSQWATRVLWMAQTTFVLWVRWPSCKGYCPVAPHAACERCAAPHVASRGWSAGPQVVPEHWHAARDDVPCRALLERLILERALPGRASPERMAVPEPRHLTSLAWQSPKRRLVQIGHRAATRDHFFGHATISSRLPLPQASIIISSPHSW